MALGSLVTSRPHLAEGAARARRWVLLGVVAGLPLLFLRSTNEPFEVPKLGLLIVGVSLATALRLIEWVQGADPRGLARLWVPAALVMVPLLVSWSLSPYRYWALFGEYRRFQGVVPYALVVLLGILVADAFGERLMELAWAFVVAGGVAAGYALMQAIGLDPFQWANIAGIETTRTSTLGNPNFTGAYLAIASPLALALWRTAGMKAEIAKRAFLLIVAGQIVSFSQGGYAAAIGGLAVFFGITMQGRWKRARVFAYAVVAVTITVVLGSVVIAMLKPDASFLPVTIHRRAQWWQGGLQMVADHPIVGRGPNSYAVEGAWYRPVRDSVSNGLDMADDVHSVPLSFATSAGLIGLGGFVGLFVWTLSRIARVDGGDVLRSGFAGAVVGYFVQSLVSIDQISLRVAFWAALGGLAVGTSAHVRKRAAVPSKGRRREPVRLLPAVIAIVLIGLFPAWWGLRFVYSDAQVWQGSLLFRMREPAAGDELFADALGFRDEYGYRHFRGVYLGATAEQTDGDDERWIAEMDRSFAFLDEVPKLFAMRDHAIALAKLDEEHPTGDRAADRYLQALNLDPYNSSLVSEGTVVLMDQRRYEAVIRLFEERVHELDAKVPELWAHLALAYERADRHEEAVAALAEAEEVAAGTEAFLAAQEAIEG